jgi:hypothetical protein
MTAALFRAFHAPQANPYAGELACDLDGGTLDYVWDGRQGGVAFSVACYDTSTFEQRPHVDVVVELDDGCDHGPIYELVSFTLDPWGGLRAETSDGVPGAYAPDDTPRTPWPWLSDDIHRWVWAFAADWWANYACRRRPFAQRRGRR